MTVYQINTEVLKTFFLSIETETIPRGDHNLLFIRQRYAPKVEAKTYERGREPEGSSSRAKLKAKAC